MPDIVRRRTAGPATHALVVGVSHYPFTNGPQATVSGRQFGLTDLTSAARSASNIARWLDEEYLNPEAPLGSLRVLLSPSEGESLDPQIVAKLPTRFAATSAAVQRELHAFRNDMRKHPGNVGIVYFAGHGVQDNKRGVTVLMEDFGRQRQRSVLAGAIDVGACRRVMDAADTPGTQFWFADACRQPIAARENFENLSPGYSLPDEGKGEADASIFFVAAASEQNAYARRGGDTVFSEALLWALRGAGVTNSDDSCTTWHVGSTRLSQIVPPRVNALLSASPHDQKVTVMGTVLDRPIQVFEAPPKVTLNFELDPENYVPIPRADLVSGDGPTVSSRSRWPIRLHVDPGIYRLDVNGAPRPYFTAAHYPEHLSKVLMP